MKLVYLSNDRRHGCLDLNWEELCFKLFCGHHLIAICICELLWHWEMALSSLYVYVCSTGFVLMIFQLYVCWYCMCSWWWCRFNHRSPACKYSCSCSLQTRLPD